MFIIYINIKLYNNNITFMTTKYEEYKKNVFMHMDTIRARQAREY